MKYLILIVFFFGFKQYITQAQNTEEIKSRADANFSIGKYWEAIKDYDILITKDPFNSKYLNTRGVIKEKSGDIYAAISDYTLAISYDSNFALAYFNRGNAYLIIRETSKACDDLKNAIEHGYKRAEKLYNENCGK